ncbi:glycosyltransferase family 4 protein [Rheinheimera fenheensis]|uniref:glycosyltransferase family 4 protein n=1 Tax=Rheinheimera fenheensis TaxID=3152295 RepID=UPI00325FF473
MTAELKGIKLCLVGPIPPPAGGMANQTRQLQQLLVQAGTQVELVAVNAPYRPAWVSGLPGIRALFRLLPYLVQLYRAIGRAQVVHVMANSGWSWHLFACPAIWLGWLRNKPVIINYRGGHAETFFAKSWRLVHFSLRRVSKVLVPSAFLQQVFQRYQYPSAIVPNILDQQLFHPVATPEALSAIDKASAVHIIVTRNLEAIYDVATAIAAFALVRQHYPNAQLSIAGSGPLLSTLQQQVQQLNLTDAVHFTGRMSIEQMAGLYQSAHLLLNTSRVDNSPNSLIEAMACAVPVVSTRVGGIGHLVRDEHDALLCEPGDVAALASASIKLLSSLTLRQHLVQHGLQNSQRFHWRDVSKQLAQHYHDVLNTQRMAIADRESD